VTDMRRGLPGLAAQVQTVLPEKPFSGHVFAFRGRRGDTVKLLWFDGDGLCLFQKRLERGRFVWPQATTGTVSLSRAQLSMLLEGVDLSTLAGWVGASSALLAPLIEAVRRHVFSAAKLHADDTPVPVLAPGNGRTKTGRLWTYVRDGRPCGDTAPPATWFAFSPDRRSEHPQAHLKSFRGTLQADAYAGFHPLYEGGRIVEAACWAHTRRKFHDIFAATESPTTFEAIRRIGLLYAVEKEVRGSPPKIRLAIRQDRARPVMTDLRSWFNRTLQTLSTKSEMAKAIRYALARWTPSPAIWMTGKWRSTTTPPNARCASSRLDARTTSSQDRTQAESAPPRSTRSSARPSSTASTRNVPSPSPQPHRQTPHQPHRRVPALER
jgi:transposase